MLEIQLSLIAQIIFYGIGIFLFFFTLKWIVTGVNDGFHFDIKKLNNFLLVLILDGMVIISIIAELHLGEIIKIV